MRLHALAKLTAALAVTLSVVTPAQQASAAELQLPEVGEQTDDVQPFVFNGHDTSNPGWIASITIGGGYTCGGSLIHPSWVLTAAHCVDTANSQYRVNVGSDRWFQGTQRLLAAVHIHPDYDTDDPSSVDLAMIRLNAPVSGTPTPRLSTNPNWPVIDQPLVVLGWGETSTNSPVPSVLQGAGVWVNSDSTGVRDDGYPYCNAVWVAASGYEDFCFGGLSWACSGDSGGPLVGRSSPSATGGDVDTIYGVTSFGDARGCSAAIFDTVGQAVGVHSGWIQGFFASSAGPGDEMFFYREDGLFRFYDVSATGGISQPIAAGSNYTNGWSSITAVDLDGDGQDEMFFYREDGLYRYYNVRSNGNIGSPIRAGTEYTRNWDAITAIDLDGDGQDEMFFYREDGLYRYYDIRPNGSIGSPIRAGSEYTNGWDSISAVDLDGDGQDEMFFYREDGLYRFYDIRPSGTIGSPIRAGDEYTQGWNSITAIDLDGDGQDEMFFYREDGLYRYYDIRPNGSIGSPIRAGSEYTRDWTAITAVELGN